ncbi:DNA-binding protein [Agromyces sp. MMS24-JH15]|uniref:DNA-binding protein n=1 Tax=Agromyces sp. MMS24-JH15 TaxID=3243765 RepID=UPI00374901AA
MYVITADQVDSRRGRDLAAALIERIDAAHGASLLLPPDQTAGDEVQVLVASAGTALDVVLEATRDGNWSVGLGVGGIRAPLPDAVRKATGPAFIAAREAVEAAKRAEGRIAVRTGAPDPDARTAAEHVDALLRLLVLLRARRSDAGWEVADQVAAGRPQKDVAADLGVSAAAVSARLKSAAWRADEAARPALAHLLDELDRRSDGDED